MSGGFQACPDCKLLTYLEDGEVECPECGTRWSA